MDSNFEILLISEDLQKDLSRIVNALKHYNLELALTKKSAYDLLNHGYRPDVVVFDICEVNIDECEIFDLILSVPSLINIPIIVIGSENNSDYQIKAFEKGAKAYISRPFLIGELLAKVKIQIDNISLNREFEERNHRLIEQLERRMNHMESISKIYSEITDELIKLKDYGVEVSRPLNKILINIDKLNALQIANIRDQEKLEHRSNKLEDQLMAKDNKLIETSRRLKVANEEITNLDSAKSTFLRIISHELRTPINGILGSISTLKLFDDSEDFLTFVEVLDESVKRLENFSYRALDISDLQTNGAGAIRRVMVTETDILNIIKDNSAETLKNKGQSLVLKTNEADQNLFLDSELVIKATTEIVKNASHFSDEMTNITIISEVKDKNEYHLTVSDQGEGFSEDSLQNVSFLNSKKHIDKNPGLGLYYAYLVANAHDGYLEYDNNQDSGAYVKLVFSNASV